MKKFFIYLSKMSSRKNMEKANINKTKFIENTQRIIGSTKKIIERLTDENKALANMYSDIPGLLEIAGSTLANLGSEFHHNALSQFIEKSLPVWDKIRLKDDTILTENLSLILPNNPYVSRIQYIYGANPSKTIYVNDSEIKNMWKLLTALVHNAVKYIIFSEDPKFYPLPPNIVDDFKVNLE